MKQNRMLDVTQGALDILGSTEIPFVSQAADLVSATISFARGDWKGGFMSLGGTIIPGMSQAKLGLGLAVKINKTTKLAEAAKGGGGWLQGGKTFAQYKASRGGTETLPKISTSTGTQRISTEFHHVFLTQRMQRAYNLPNWAVNNRLNVWKLNTVQHSLIDSYRYNFLRAGFKPDVGWFGKYNWFTKF